MDFGHPKTKMSRNSRHRVAPDFAVLVAGLSANQSSSVTARQQVELDRISDSQNDQSPPLVSLFASGKRAFTAKTLGSFSVDVAETLVGEREK